MAAAQALEGEFSEDGLAAMAGEDNLQMALAKSLADRIDDSDMQRSWSKVKSGPRKSAKHSPLDDLPAELQLVAEALIASQRHPIPAEASAEVRTIHQEIDDRNAALELMDEFDQVPESAVDPTILAFPRTFDEGVDSTMPELTEEILARMFANIMEHGMAI